MKTFPDKKYDIIYADPPWKYKGARIGTGSHVETPYPEMTIAELCDLPVSDIADDDCLLFMWVISQELHNAIDVAKAWGFKYTTIGFVWDKHNPTISYYTLGQCEICLIFKKGKIPKPRGKRNMRQFLSCKKGGHSVKPLEIQHRITEMFPTQSKIELFARPSPLFKGLEDGWDYWGNEV